MLRHRQTNSMLHRANVQQLLNVYNLARLENKDTIIQLENNVAQRTYCTKNMINGGIKYPAPYDPGMHKAPSACFLHKKIN